MARLARIVVPGIPHHITARGNRREPIFFEDGDQDLYRDILGDAVRKERVEVWAYVSCPITFTLSPAPRPPKAWAEPLGRPIVGGPIM